MPSASLTRSLAAAAALLVSLDQVSALWRMQCDGVLANARIDPLVNPGVPSAHLHTLHGGNALGLTTTVEDLLSSDCTSCQVTKDKSAYWSAALYFQEASTGQLSLVPEVSHLTYYKYTPLTVNGVYTFPSALPNGFQMISGDPFERNFTLPVPDPPMPWYGDDATQHALAQKAIGFNCLNYGATPEPSLYRHFLPTKEYIDGNCPDGIRMELLFPQCWNGKDLTSSTFKSHVAFPSATINGGECPSGYDSVINQIFFETIVNTAAFAGQAGQFVLSDGDPTGYGFHGDLIIAWEDNFLEEATKTCGPDLTPSDPGFSGQVTDCPVFQPVLNDQAEMQSCKLSMPPSLMQDSIKGPLAQLPGNVPIIAGPEYAKPNGPKPTAAPAAPASVSLASTPTLSYTAGSTGSNPEVGNIFLQSSTSAPASSSTTLAVMVSPSPAAAQAPPAVPEPASASPPAITPAPSVVAATAAPPGAGLSTVTTEYYTKGQDAYEVVVFEEEVTVTVTPDAPAPTGESKRDLREKKRRGHEHLAHLKRHNHHLGGRM
ncbi:hypothetical protein MMC25_004406 [Agyrium rufum]|nr:hypothetical protein [Agyrium rufum]